MYFPAVCSSEDAYDNEGDAMHNPNADVLATVKKDLRLCAISVSPD
jgi:hypothetical protein